MACAMLWMCESEDVIPSVLTERGLSRLRKDHRLESLRYNTTVSNADSSFGASSVK